MSQSAGADPLESCTNCGAPRASEYCPECGERRLRPDEYSLRRLLVDWSRDVISLDSKVWASFRALILRPGRLTADYMKGRRARYMSPVQLFLTANLIYFVVQPYTGFSGFNTPLDSHMERQSYSEALAIGDRVRGEARRRTEVRVAQAIEARTPDDGVLSEADSLALFERMAAVEGSVYPTEFNATAEVYSRALVVMIIPMMVIALWVLFLGTRTPFVQHVVFATHLHAWDLFFIYSTFLPLLRVFVRSLYTLIGAAQGLTMVEVFAQPVAGRIYFTLMEQGSTFIVFLYTAIALRVAYGSGWLPSVIRAAIIAIGLVMMVVVFRLVVFWLTYWTI